MPPPPVVYMVYMVTRQLTSHAKSNRVKLLLKVELPSNLVCLVLEVYLLIGRHVGTSVFARWMQFRST